MSDGAVKTYEEGQKLLDLGGDGNSPEMQPSQQKVNEAAGDPKAAMMAMLAKRGGGESSSGEGGGGGGVATVQLKDCPKYGKYFKMLKVRSHREYWDYIRDDYVLFYSCDSGSDIYLWTLFIHQNLIVHLICLISIFKTIRNVRHRVRTVEILFSIELFYY